MQYSVYSERHIKGRLEAVIDRVLEVFDHHATDAVPSELCTRSEAVELQDMTQGLMALLFNDRKAFLESAKQMRERIDQACELLTRILEGSNMMMQTENGDAVGLPQAVHGLRTTLSGTPVPPSATGEGIALNLVGLLSGFSWAAPQPVIVVGWFVWDLLWIFEACVTEDSTHPLEAIDAMLVCPVTVVVQPAFHEYASLAPEAAALACACLFYQISWSRSLSQTIEAFPQGSYYNGTDNRAVQSWHNQHAQDKERLLEAAWRRCGPSVCVPNSLGELIFRTAAPWSRTLHRYFPPAARARAIEVLRAGALLANGLEQSSGLMDIWVELVMPLVLSRFPRGTGMLWDADKGLWRDGSGVMNGSSLYA